MAEILSIIDPNSYEYAAIGGGYHHDIQMCPLPYWPIIKSFYEKSGFDKLIGSPPESCHECVLL